MKTLVIRCLIFCVMLSNIAAGQIKIEGIVVDAQTNQPVSFASIRTKDGSAGTAANKQGAFIFQIAEGTSDSVKISSVGYSTLTISMTHLRQTKRVFLQPAVVQLAEITIKVDHGLDLVKEAVRRIPINYDTANHRLTAFYREATHLDTFELSYSEVIVDIHKTFKVAKHFNDEIAILKGRKKRIDFGAEAQLYHFLSGISNGVRGILYDDLLKFRDARFSPLNPENFEHYKYEFLETIHDQDRNILVIEVSPEPKAKEAYLHMTLFLDEASLAIVRYEFHLTEEGVRYVSKKDKGIGYAIMKNVVHASKDYRSFQSTYNYRQIGEKWYLDRVNRHWEILVNSKRRKWVRKPWYADMDLVVTEVRKDSINEEQKVDIGQHQGSIQSHIEGEFDDEFWEDYNFILDDQKGSELLTPDSTTSEKRKEIGKKVSNRRNGFTRADSLRGSLTSFRTCYDVTFYHLDVEIDLTRRTVGGRNSILFTAMEPITTMQIDLHQNFHINGITIDGENLNFSREHNAVFIHFFDTLMKGSNYNIVVDYNGVPKAPDLSIPMDGGVLWDRDSLGNIWVQVVCQGTGASLWWPNKDHQSDEPDSMKIWITVPSDYIDISNGQLQRVTTLSEYRNRYEWFVSYPINNYNVTFNVGKYAHLKDRYRSVENDSLDLNYYVMAYNAKKEKQIFANVKRMLSTFEKYFGSYPFQGDGFALVESLYPMEHQSGVCIGQITAETNLTYNRLMWHESAHEWWGNSLTCEDVADMWIHEAFATYAEILIVEDWFGKEAITSMLEDQLDAVIGEEPITGVYCVNHIHYDIGDMYSKGTLMIHTLRSVLHDDHLFFNLLKSIQAEFKHQTITAHDVISFISEFTKIDLRKFFDQYLLHVGIPELQIRLEPGADHLQVHYRWETDVNDFAMPARVTVNRNQYDLIHPKNEWQSMTLRNIDVASFDVDDENFYINVVIQ